MNPRKVQRNKLFELEDLPNIGKTMAADLRCIGIRSPIQLAGRDPFQLYEALCQRTGVRHDPCVIDVFMSVVHFMDGGDALPWWSFTQPRKRTYKPG
ncbi:MAG: helix-hairpin-helix domain-containing protein [Nitrosomonadales bacterium]|nr:helix-hairpin-helix domain-containing protein [Nitrosomonadales bacterium]